MQGDSVRVRTAVAASVLAAAASFPLAGVALAEGGDCSDMGSRAEVLPEAYAGSGHLSELDAIVCEGLIGIGLGGSVDGTDGNDGTGTDGTDGADGSASGVGEYEKGDKGDTASHGADDYTGSDDSGPAPVGGIETGAGGTAAGGTGADDVELLLPLSLAGGAALAAGGVVLVRRRLADQVG